MCNISEYENIFNRVSAIRCSEEKINSLKDEYAHVINSKRRLQRIKDLPDFLRVLQKRDCINPNNVDILSNIAETLGEFSIKPIFSQYNLNSSYNSNNTNSSSNSHGIYNVNAPKQQQNVIPRLSRDPKDKMYQVIASDIGQKWTNLARALHVPEGYIDGLHETRSIDRVYEILRFHEETCDKRMWFSSLLDALTVARHNELRKRVQKIFDTHTV